jgi:uncharacterized membrane protein
LNLVNNIQILWVNFSTEPVWQVPLISVTIFLLALTLGVQIVTVIKRPELNLPDGRVNYILSGILLLAGLSIAGYLSFNKLLNRTTICFIAEGCDAVQNSPYATLPGGIPTGSLGFAAYLALTLLFGLYILAPKKIKSYRPYFPVVIVAILVINNAFLIYLNYLEMVVLHALCSWCWTFAMVNLILSWQILRANLKSK